MSEPVELRCGMCNGTGIDPSSSGPQACWMCDGTTTVVAHLDGKYVAADALLSDEAVEAAASDTGHLAQCGVEEYGGCGGTHAECYYRSKLRAAIDAVTGEQPETPSSHCLECLRIASELPKFGVQADRAQGAA